MKLNSSHTTINTKSQNILNNYPAVTVCYTDGSKSSNNTSCAVHIPPSIIQLKLSTSSLIFTAVALLLYLNDIHRSKLSPLHSPSWLSQCYKIHLRYVYLKSNHTTNPHYSSFSIIVINSSIRHLDPSSLWNSRWGHSWLGDKISFPKFCN